MKRVLDLRWSGKGLQDQCESFYIDAFINMEKNKVKFGSVREEDNGILKCWKACWSTMGTSSRGSSAPGLSWKGPVALMFFRFPKKYFS